MTGVPRHVAKHRLNVHEGCPPVRQKKRSQAPERNKAIQEELERLMESRIMKEVYYHIWLSNPVMVKKHGDSWRMCLDFKHLNKACSKDGYPLPKIDWKNSRATYQRLVDKAFQKQIGRNLEVYVDDLTTKAEAAFKQMKKLIAELLTLTALMEKEELIVYLAATREVVSAVLMTEREAKQIPIYFVSRALQGPEKNYTPVEKLVLALVLVSKWLKRSKVSIKGQILADFIVERPEDDSLAVPIEVEEELLESWTLFTDGSSCIDGFGAGLILTNPEGTEFTYALRFEFNATNNEAEYEALIDGLGIAEQMGIKKPLNKCRLPPSD
ncbi:reverse transcriptase domain-containing protein [Tanacetum coccineum]